MNRVMARWAGMFAALALSLPVPAMADFSIQKPKAKTPTASTPRPMRPRRPRAEEAEPAPAAVPVVTGMDPQLMQQTIAAAKYSAKLIRDPGGQTALIEVTDGKIGWSVNFKNCVDETHCGFMEFYTLWRVSNENNVCTVWGTDVTKDPTRNLGKPFCYTVPTLAGQLHLKLSSDQGPYLGMDRLTPEQAQDRMRGMIATWQSYLPQLQDAWKIATAKCPRATVKCPGPMASGTPTSPSTY